MLIPFLIDMKRIYIVLISNLIAFCSFAQKLPDIQTTNLNAPTSIKVDGKLMEWNDTFAAENKRTEIFYSIANDEKNLYLVLKSASSSNTNKILAGGITFSVNTQGKKKEKESYSVTYPLIKRVQSGGRQGQNRQGGQGGQGGFQNRTQQTPQQRDSVALVTRKEQLSTVKELKVGGFKTITDTLVSIYNEYGIKAFGAFNAKGTYVYELAIPLSLLELSINDKNEFVYQIKVNGLSAMGFGGGGGNAGRGNGGNFGGNGGGNFGGGARPGGGGFGGGTNSTTDMMSPTDFWGKYTLINK